jgi:hypothetical protein
MMTKIGMVDSVMALALMAAGIGAGALATQGCSSSSSTGSDAGRDTATSGDYLALCNQSCEKAVTCLAGDAGAAGAQAAAQCMQQCTTQSGTMSAATCTNSAAIISAVRACLAMSCDGYIGCIQSVPPCDGGGGGLGGSSGGGLGGSTGGGTGGSSGNASCSACGKANSCCVALFTAVGQDTTSCSTYSTSSCNAQPAAAQTQLIAACNSVVMSGANAGIAACQ